MSRQSDNTIYYWPDGTWCYAFEYNEVNYQFKGDDFGKLVVPDHWEEFEINRAVDDIVLFG